MNLQSLFPKTAGMSHADRLQELMRGFLYRSNFVPGVRHVLGWRGLKDCSTLVAGWTAKIKDYAGVFALYFQSSETRAEWRIGRFGLVYFPDPDEDLIENMSVAGLLRARRNDYRSQIREFVLHRDLAELFTIGELTLGLHSEEKSLLLGMESMNRQCSMTLDGITLPVDGKEVKLVEAGGWDQDFPAYDVSLGFWRVIAASLVFSLEETPRYLHQHQAPGAVIVYDAAGRHREEPREEIRRQYLYLGFGPADFEDLLNRLHPQQKEISNALVWQHDAPLPQEHAGEIWWQAHQISDYKTLDKQSLGIDERPQLIILTGFLGAGKTSFLQHFIEHQLQRSRFVAVIQNEIGEIGLDGKLTNDNYFVTEIDEGCVCCTLTGNLKKAVRLILSDFQPDCIVLETTGLANPFNLLDEMNALEAIVRFDSVTTVVDGVDAMQILEQQPIAVDQVKAADILLLNKQDLVSSGQLRQVHDRLRRLNPHAPVFKTTGGDVPPALIYDIEWTGNGQVHPERPTAGSAPTHAGQGVWIKTLHQDRPIDRSEFMRAIAALPPSVLRAKGIVNLAEPNQTLLVQYVAGRTDFSEFNNTAVTDRFLVLIGQGTDKSSSAPQLPPVFAQIGLNPPIAQKAIRPL